MSLHGTLVGHSFLILHSVQLKEYHSLFMNFTDNGNLVSFQLWAIMNNVSWCMHLSYIPGSEIAGSKGYML